MMRSLPILLAAGLLALDGYVYGLWTNRWQTSQAIPAAVARLDQVPMAFGDWQGENLEPLSAREVEQAGFEGYISRVYKNRRTGSALNVLLACGRAGPMSVHTPDVCYRGRGYQAI